MKVNPSSFEAHVKHMDLSTIEIVVQADHNNRMQRIFSNDFRKINAQDPNFYYTCVCNEKYTVWRFAYGSSEVLAMARMYFDLTVAVMMATDPELNQNPVYIEPDDLQGCVCPFDEKK